MASCNANIAGAVLILALTSVSVLLKGQQVTGSIIGSVQDATGAAIVASQVTAKNQDTGLTRSVQTDAQGEYRIDFLPPGNYEVDVSDTGFRSFRQTGVTLQVGQSARIDAQLQLGQVSRTLPAR